MEREKMHFEMVHFSVQPEFGTKFPPSPTRWRQQYWQFRKNNSLKAIVAADSKVIVRITK